MSKILLIDDDAASRGFFKTVAEKLLMMDTEEAGSISEAIDRIAEGGIDVIFLDNTLSDGDANAFCARLKQTAPEAMAIPKYVVTGAHPLACSALWTECGILGFLLKPCSIDEIKATVNKCLSKK
ncbi:MAG: response regulator [Elusimicrobiaceae bacterium]